MIPAQAVMAERGLAQRAGGHEAPGLSVVALLLAPLAVLAAEMPLTVAPYLGDAAMLLAGLAGFLIVRAMRARRRVGQSYLAGNVSAGRLGRDSARAHRLWFLAVSLSQAALLAVAAAWLVGWFGGVPAAAGLAVLLPALACTLYGARWAVLGAVRARAALPAHLPAEADAGVVLDWRSRLATAERRDLALARLHSRPSLTFALLASGDGDAPLPVDPRARPGEALGPELAARSSALGRIFRAAVPAALLAMVATWLWQPPAAWTAIQTGSEQAALDAARSPGAAPTPADHHDTSAGEASGPGEGGDTGQSAPASPSEPAGAEASRPSVAGEGEATGGTGGADTAAAGGGQDNAAVDEKGGAGETAAAEASDGAGSTSETGSLLPGTGAGAGPSGATEPEAGVPSLAEAEPEGADLVIRMGDAEAPGTGPTTPTDGEAGPAEAAIAARAEFATGAPRAASWHAPRHEPVQPVPAWIRDMLREPEGGGR